MLMVQRQRLGLVAIIVGGTFFFLLTAFWFRDALGLGSRVRRLRGSARQSLVDDVFNGTFGVRAQGEPWKASRLTLE